MLKHPTDLRGDCRVVIILSGFVTMSHTFHITHCHVIKILIKADLTVDYIKLPAIETMNTETQKLVRTRTHYHSHIIIINPTYWNYRLTEKNTAHMVMR